VEGTEPKTLHMVLVHRLLNQQCLLSTYSCFTGGKAMGDYKVNTQPSQI